MPKNLVHRNLGDDGGIQPAAPRHHPSIGLPISPQPTEDIDKTTALEDRSGYPVQTPEKEIKVSNIDEVKAEPLNDGGNPTKAVTGTNNNKQTTVNNARLSIASRQFSIGLEEVEEPIHRDDVNSSTKQENPNDVTSKTKDEELGLAPTVCRSSKEQYGHKIAGHARDKKTRALGLFTPFGSARRPPTRPSEQDNIVHTQQEDVSDDFVTVDGTFMERPRQPVSTSGPGAFAMTGLGFQSDTDVGQRQQQQSEREEQLVLSAEPVEEMPLVVGTPARPRRIIVILVLAVAVIVAIAVVLSITLNRKSTEKQGNEGASSPEPREPGTWAQIGPDLVGVRPVDVFGFSVALSPDGTVLAVGAPKNNDDGRFSGQVRVFRRSSDGTEWEPLGQPIQGSQTNDEVGASVALSANGSVLAVGASQWLKSDGNTTGYARVFSLVTEGDTASWVQIGQDLLGEANGDKFGWAVALSVDGETVAIGAFENSEGGFNAGLVRAFRMDAESKQWVQLGQAIKGTADDSLGGDVSLSGHGNVLAIGADQWESGGSPGYAKVFELSGGERWSQVGQTLIGSGSDDRFGNTVSLSLSGRILAVGAWLNDANGPDTGHVRVFELQNGGTDWVQMGQDIVGDNVDDHFGREVSLSADGRVVSIGSDQCCGLPGYARVYHLTEGGNWTQYGQDLVGKAPDDRFGWRVSLSADGLLLVVGGYGNEGNTGIVRVYEMQPNSERWILRRHNKN